MMVVSDDASIPDPKDSGLHDHKVSKGENADVIARHEGTTREDMAASNPGSDLDRDHDVATEIARKAQGIPGVSEVYIPQNLDYPALRLNIDRVHASELGLSQREVITNVITALTSNGMIAPSYWIDPKTGNNYMLTVQYSNERVGNMTMTDFRNIPLRAPKNASYTPLQSVAKIESINTPTEVDHYQIRRVIDVYVMPTTEDLSGVSADVQQILKGLKLPPNAFVRIQGAVVGMHKSFLRF